MRKARYVILNPSGNLTALVTEWPGRESEAEITSALMKESEQVAYLEPAVLPGSLARIRLMGGEFCGNDAMASAGWLIRSSLQPGEHRAVPLEVSGAQGIVSCEIQKTAGGFRGTVRMPKVLSIAELKLEGISFVSVRLEGILHLIREASAPLTPGFAEELLRRISFLRPAEEAIGLLDFNPETGFMRPLIYVRGSGTFVWETACGSGSAAVGALRAWQKSSGDVVTSVFQPGGVISVRAVAAQGQILEVSITGDITFGMEKEMLLADSSSV